MADSDRLIRNISDTARWAAVYRAEETKRRGALFSDPFAAKLAGERGRQIFDSMPPRRRQSWAWVVRTYLFDHFINESLATGVDMVVNLAAGLDARPYRMALPSTLQWIEVDLPEILAYKAEILANDRPACALERFAVDLSIAAERRGLFAMLNSRATRTLVITEGLLLYLDPENVASFAEDLAAQPTFERWILDLASPGLLKMLQKQLGAQLGAANAPPKFGPAEGPAFFDSHGWRPASVQSMLAAAAGVYPLPLLMRFFSMFPEPATPGNRPWSGVVLLEKGTQNTEHAVVSA
jgi:methyltransferase (TIGR00027 family)